MENYADILFVDDVRTLQEQEGTAQKYKDFYPKRTKESLDDADREFIVSRESFYIASVSTSGWPYVQHRGGPAGFLKVIGDNRLGFNDYPGNRQFITMGHATRENRVALFLMDYERRARLKLLGRLSMQHAAEVAPELRDQLATPGQAPAERVAIIDIVAIDWNCPKYIPQMIGIEKINRLFESQLRQLTQENESLKAQLEKLRNSGDP